MSVVLPARLRAVAIIWRQPGEIVQIHFRLRTLKGLLSLTFAEQPVSHDILR